MDSKKTRFSFFNKTTVGIIGIFVMLFTGADTIREVILFPTMKPLAE